MTTIHGFELLREDEIPELNTRARLFRHVKTGAELISMENDDENKTFGITFATPPSDSTGLPHIMEHSVLCGSRKYPVKEPFVELIKSSLNTFLNAMTFPDKTTYPVASQNVKDLYNLVDVYLDAVFYPRITPEILQQEGWHYELENADDPLTYKGVVFNEMKGAYSSPDSLLGRYAQQALFPDTVYGQDSGGDPAVIPDLTYEDFREFHSTYYHPSNARIWFYGDDDADERLRYVDAFIRDFEARQVDATIPLQPKFSEPRHVTQVYTAEEGESGKKGMVTVSWLLPENNDAELSLAFDILSHILVGTPASPLRKALIDSDLGEDLTGGGFSDYLRQMEFSAGLKGIAVEDADKVETLILDTLGRLAQDGIEQDMVEAALNTTEFQLREMNTGRFPRGLALMISALSTWLHNGDPIARMRFEGPLAAIKGRLTAGERFFEGLITEHLLNNPHRVTLLLKPDPDAQRQQEEAEKERLARARAAMSQEQLEGIIDKTRELKQMQETPDSPEALAKIPTLTLDDLDRENKVIPLEALEWDGSRVLYHDLFTNGITYLDLGFDLHALPQEYLPYVGLFSRALLEMGTETEDFVKLSQRIGRKTGGIRPSMFTSAVQAEPSGAAWLFLRGKATMEQTADLLAILQDVLLTVKLNNKERFRQMVLESKAGMEARLVPGGHAVVNSRLRARFSEADWASEQMGGISYLLFLRELAEKIEKDWPSVLEKLEAVRQRLVNRQNMLCNVTLDGENWARFETQLNGFLAALPSAPVQAVVWSPEYASGAEGLTIPAKVNYVAKGANLYDLGYTRHGSISVIGMYLRTTWLWERVRVQGGAYGGFLGFDQHSGVFSYFSYRDPNLLGTLDNYDATGKFLRELEISPEEVARSIIGTIGDMDAYQLPDAKGYTSMVHHLVGYTPERRQQVRDEILATTAQDFKRFADVLDQVSREGVVVVMGSQEAIEKANAERGNWLGRITKVL